MITPLHTSGAPVDVPVASSRRELEHFEIWQDARSIRNAVYFLEQSLPHEERERLGDRMVRLSRDMTTSIAQSHGKGVSKAGIFHLRQARGALYGLLDCLDTAAVCNLVPEQDCGRLCRSIRDLSRLITCYMRFLKKKMRTQAVL